MLNVAQLRERWTSRKGEELRGLLQSAFRGTAGLADFSARQAAFVGIEEVAPALDLRGIELTHMVLMQQLDLSGARFDLAKLNGGFSGSKLRKAIFDGASGRNVDFATCDLEGSSFINAKLPGAVFYNVNLSNADLSQIAMHSGQFKGANCQRAKFVGADLRMVWAADADLRGADLSESNLIGASLGAVKWDSSTQIKGARLSFEGTPKELQVQALAQGASLRSEKPEWELNLFDATMKSLEGEEGRGIKEVLDKMSQMRASVKRDPDFPWADMLQRQIKKEDWEILEKAVRKAASNMGALLT